MARAIILPGQVRRFRVQVNGTPAAQGSKEAIPYRKAGGKLGVRVVNPADRKAKISNWRADVKAAVEASLGPDWGGPMEGPLQAHITFTVHQPAQPRRVRDGLGRMLLAVPWPWQRPDLDKFVRATFDALTAAGVWLDDAQVVGLTTWKLYPSHPAALPVPGAVIEVRQLATVKDPSPDAVWAEPAGLDGQAPVLFEVPGG